MSLTIRILLGFLLVGGLCFYFFLDRILLRIERQYLEAAEEPMVDAANLLAGMVTVEIQSTTEPSWATAVREAATRNPAAQIYTKFKDRVEMDFYLTDEKGWIVFDTSGRHAVGTDHSFYLDVWQTLRGEYGARSTRLDPNNDRSSVMYVGAPIYAGGKIAGVLSVYKPQRSLHEFMDETQRVLKNFALLAMGAMLLGGLLVSRWITSPLRALAVYVDAVARGEKPRRPRFPSQSMERLVDAFEDMRDAVQGKNEIESYVQTLTHEMKSPVAAIRGAAELLTEPMPEEQRIRFLGNIRAETERLANFTERLLRLSAVERRKELENREVFDLHSLVRDLTNEARPSLQNKKLKLEIQIPGNLQVCGDPTLLRIAISNLLQNAMDFSPEEECITIRAETSGSVVVMDILDRGPGVPEYAAGRIFERFYSLPRPGSGKKSTGLGLCFVKETLLLHNGTAELLPREGGGTVARIQLPTAC